jgi:hypothetical protein
MKRLKKLKRAVAVFRLRNVEREGRTPPRRQRRVKVEDINFKCTAAVPLPDRRAALCAARHASAKMQRCIVREVKRARHLALLPYTADQTRQVRRRR